MTRIANIAVGVSLALAGCLLNPGAAFTEPIRYWGQNAELSISEGSGRTVQIVLAPLDEKGKALPGPNSTVLVEQKLKVKLRLRELKGVEKFVAGKLSVLVKREPLTISIGHLSGKIVQELVFGEGEGEGDGSMTFRTK